MIVEKDRIRRIIHNHKDRLFQDQNEDELVSFFYETFSEMAQLHEEKLATKEDIKMVIQMMEKRFEAIDKRFEAIDKRFEAVDKRFEGVNKRFEDMYRYMDKRFEDMNKRFNTMFTFMNIGFGIIILLTVLFKFMQ